MGFDKSPLEGGLQPETQEEKVKVEEEKSPHEVLLDRIEALNALNAEIMEQWPALPPDEVRQALEAKRAFLHDEVEKAYDKEHGIGSEEQAGRAEKRTEMYKQQIGEFLRKLEEI